MELDSLDKAFTEVLNKFPKAKGQLVEDVGDMMYNQVIENIERDTNEKTGNLKKGVTKVIGSKGGYAAIKNDYGIAPHVYLIEKGHNQVSKTGEITGWVHGKYMYRKAINQTADKIEGMAEQMMESIASEFK